MSKDLLKEAIADAKAVRETAIANAKLALEEAFTPKLQSMLSTKIREEYDEDEEEKSEDVYNEMEMDDEEEKSEAKLYDDEAEEEEMESEAKMYDEDEDEDGEMKAEAEEEDDDDKMENLELEAIIRELEEGEDHDEDEKEKMESVNEEDEDEEEKTEAVTEDSDIDLAEVIKALQEEDEEDEEMKAEATELEEAYETIRFLKDKINEVNLLNAKLLFSNKLFRSGNLNEDQKMRVIETFDRANSVREVKLVYSTLAESMKASKSSTKKKAMTEGLASKTTRSTKPSKKAIVESNDFSDRMRKLAGLI